MGKFLILHIRVPQELKEKLWKLAVKSNRSLNNMITVILESYFNKED